MNITGEISILKDDRGICKTTICNKSTSEDGEENTQFMQINVGFRKGTEIKNKARIDIKNGFLTFYIIETEDDEGNITKRRFPKIMILDFDVIEEGIDEPFVYKKYENQQEANKNDEEGNFFNSFENDDELPF